MRKRLLLIGLLSGLLSCTGAGAQPVLSLSLGTDAPLTYALGVDARWSPRFSTEARLHVLAPPYDRAILGIAEAFGLSDTLSRAIGAAFRVGVGASVSGRYHFGAARRHGVRLMGQYLHLDGGNTAIDLLEASLGRDLSPLRAPQPGSPPPLELALQVDLWLLGVYYSYDLPLGPDRSDRSRWFLRLEAGLAKVVGSTSTLASNRPRLDATRPIQALYSDLAAELRQAFADYGYAPTLNVHLGWRFVR